MAFRFKQFTVEDNNSTMRIGTDAVLLGAWAEPGKATSVLDIGTGCGVISIMLAQKSTARIDAIDIDEDSVSQAGSNFLQCPWKDRIQAFQISIQEITLTSDKKYDLIITNPPYFTGSLPSPDKRKNMARHTSSLSPKDLITGINHLLHVHGCYYMILPVKEHKIFTESAEKAGLSIIKTMQVRPKTGKPVNRVISKFGFHHYTKSATEELVIRNNDNSFSSEYIAFTRAYYFSL